MRVSTFITDIGNILQEDFENVTLWTKAELLGYLRQTLREFSARTNIFDASMIRVVNATTGEAGVPSDFNLLYYTQFDQIQKDIVQLSELDFIDSDWMLGGTATTPLAATVYASGAQAKVRFAPVPSTVSGALDSGTVSNLTLADSGSNIWTITIANGVLVSTLGGSSAGSVVISGPSTFWDLTITTAGVLTTSASASTSADVVYLDDTVTTDTWTIYATDLGVLQTRTLAGVAVSVKLDNTYQTIVAGANSSNANYGVVVDAYATGVSTTPSSVMRLNTSMGTDILHRNADDSAMLWYKNHAKDVTSTESNLFLSDPFIAVVKHGVLALAYGREGDGRDSKKAKILKSLFEAECLTIKRLFERR